MNALTSPIVTGRDRSGRVILSRAANKGIQHDYPERGVVREVTTSRYLSTTGAVGLGGSLGGTFIFPSRLNQSSQDERGACAS